ncbi:NACHT domain-containing protein [Streptomyces sp. I05A-00742]|uniref:NACHT domain-containing protein n=1 Tax=Streptomyces sp. I05A-00742 TaxID=2732853 RepID=UPI001488A47B|nr:NACHT domain-containing protein [Streptomyces sp. I05A-00742]
MRWRWTVTWALCAAVTCGLLWVWPLRDPARISAAAAVVSAVVALFGVVSVWARRAERSRAHSSGGQVADAAEVLARTVRRQWEEEAVLRQLYDPEPLRLVWSDCSHPGVSDHRQLVGTQVVCRAGGPEEELAGAFRSLARRRLVVLGPGESGKTTFAVLLLLALLRTRATGDPVPVLFSLSSFDPARESAGDWLRRRIGADYPAMTDTEHYGASVIEDLLTDRLLIPVLDGLDELPERSRAAALASLNDTLPSDTPLVLTCRTDDYVRAVAESGVLTGAAVLESAPVRADDALALLRLATPPGPRQQGWDALADHLVHHPRAPAAQALASPLMVALTRSVYADDDNDPAELLDTRRFSAPSDIERHLLDALVPALYRRARRQRPDRGWDPRRAQEHLARIATGMHAQGTYDLAWWQLYRWTPALAGAWRRAGTWALVTCAGFMLATAFQVAVLTVPSWSEALRWFPQSLLESLICLAVLALGGLITVRRSSLAHTSATAAVVSLCGGLAALPSSWSYYRGGVPGTVPAAAVGFFCFSMWLVMLGAGLPSPPRTPSRSRPARRHWRRQLIRALVLVIGIATISETVFTGYTMAGFDDVVPPGTVPWGLVIGIVAGISLAALDWIRDPSTADDVATAASSVRADRLVSLISGAACAVVFLIPDGAIRALPWVPSDPLRTTTFAAVAGLLHGGLWGSVLALTAHSWPHYTLARLLLAARDELPWRLQAFLADAHRLGILRQVGPVYQFRHARLQHHLATRPALPTPRTDRTDPVRPPAPRG